MKKVLITGGSGLVGQVLSQMLLEKGYRVAWLSRKTKSIKNIEVYEWDIQRQYIDPKALDAQLLVHLAGENVGQGHWTAQRKAQIIESRTLSSQLLAKSFADKNLEVFVAASAIGLYGNTYEHWADENTLAGKDFLAKVVVEWEKELQKIPAQRTVINRVGVVLSKKDGALEKIALPIRFWAGAALGSGKQYLSWIHQKDLCRIFIKAIEDSSMQGIFNAVAPEPVTNEVLTKKIAEVLEKPLFLPNIPEFVLKILLGEMSQIVLNGSRVSAKKIIDTGFEFEFADLNACLRDLL